MSNKSESETYFEEYAEAAGLRPTDMPNSHHPLMENDDEVKTLSDLIDARENEPEEKGGVVRELMRGRDQEIDVSDALTFPHAASSSRAADTADITDFDADARTSSEPDDEADSSYMTRADFVDSMNETDPDPNAGMDADEFIGDEVEEDRAPDLSGTVTGIARGMATHLPQDIGAQGFQIEDPEEGHDPQFDAETARGMDARSGHTDPTTAGAEDSTPGHDNLTDGDVIPTTPPNVNSRDEALDATRRIR